MARVVSAPALVGIAVIAALGGGARAAGGGKAATFAVEIRAEAEEGWRAEAIAAALRVDVVDDQLKLAGAGVEAQLVVRGELRGAELAYVIERRDGGAPVRGTIAIAGSDRRGVAGVVRDVLHRIARPAEDMARPGPPAELEEPGGGGAAGAALVGFAAVMALPIGLGAVVLRGRRRELVRSRALRRCAAAIAAIGGVAYGLIAHGERVPELAPVVLIAGGMAWGGVVAALVPIGLPPLPGLHRVEEGELLPVIGAWLGLAVQRCVVIAAVLVPIGVAAAAIGDALGAPRVIALGVIAPVAVLGGRLVVRASVEVLALRLDAELVEGAEAEAWHAQVRAYFVGYLRRANLDVDEDLLERVRFLPGREDGVAVYGGGLAHARIVVGRAMLEHALAPYGRPHDYLVPRVSTLHWTHWNAGLVMPTEAGARLASAEDRKPHAVADEAERATDSERIALGEPPTLSGIIEPTAFDPRTGYRPDEDPLWLDWDPGEEYDGTDAGDKDYLFGALVEALGAVVRHEDRAATLALAWRRLGPRRARAWSLGPLGRFAAQRRHALGDAYAVLGGARHHLAQYLAWRLWRREDLITARAYVPELEQRSAAIAREVARPEASAASAASADRARLARLQRFAAPAVEVARPRRRRVVLALGAAAGLAAIAALVVQAVLYHSTWEARVKTPPTARGEERALDGKGQ